VSGEALLRFAAVCQRYEDGSRGLEECSLSIRPGSRNALLGPNGAGKTTLLLHGVGLLRPARGQVEFLGRPLDYGRAGLRQLRQRVGLVFQNPERQLLSASVYEDVSFGPLNLGLPEAQVRQRVEAALGAVGLADCRERALHQLSFGQKKRVCIAGVLAMEPELLLLDEPLAGLDGPMRREFEALLEQLAGQGITILLSTHDVDFAYRWADDLHLLAEGRCLASFPARELPRQQALLAAAGQALPAVLGLHRRLADLGLLPAEPPRSLDALLAALDGAAPDLKRNPA